LHRNIVSSIWAQERPAYTVSRQSIKSIEGDRLGAEPAAGSCLSPRGFGCSTDQIPENDSERGFIGIFEVFYKYALEFDGYLLSCAKMPGAKESDPD
jgi:hypothetical protein